MKIVQVSSGKTRVPPTKEGAHQIVIFNISKKLASMGHEVVILDRKYSGDHLPIDYMNDLQIVRLDVRQIRFGKAHGFVSFAINELNIVLFALKVCGYLRRDGHNIDIIHIHLTLIGAILVILNRGLRNKMVYTCHIGQWTLANSRLNIIERIHLFIDSFLIRRVAKVIALNYIAKESLISKGRMKVENIAVIPNGVDTDFFNDNIDAEWAVQRYGLGKKLIVLFVGRLAKIKGIENLIQAAGITVNEFGYKDIAFVLVGPHAFDSTERPIDMRKILNLIEQHHLEKNVMLTGSLPSEEVRMLYAACDIFVLPSLAETGPIVTLEAMASGKPVIATKVGDTLHQIRDGWNGFLVDPTDDQQLAEKIKYLIDNPDEREKMGLNARRYAEEEFDWKKAADKLALVYHSMSISH